MKSSPSRKIVDFKPITRQFFNLPEVIALFSGQVFTHNAFVGELEPLPGQQNYLYFDYHEVENRVIGKNKAEFICTVRSSKEFGSTDISEPFKVRVWYQADNQSWYMEELPPDSIA